MGRQMRGATVVVIVSVFLCMSYNMCEPFRVNAAALNANTQCWGSVCVARPVPRGLPTGPNHGFMSVFNFACLSVSSPSNTCVCVGAQCCEGNSIVTHEYG